MKAYLCLHATAEISAGRDRPAPEALHPLASQLLFGDPLSSSHCLRRWLRTDVTSVILTTFIGLARLGKTTGLIPSLCA
jgi:hypothetical protein